MNLTYLIDFEQVDVRDFMYFQPFKFLFIEYFDHFEFLDFLFLQLF